MITKIFDKPFDIIVDVDGNIIVDDKGGINKQFVCHFPRCHQDWIFPGLKILDT